MRLRPHTPELPRDGFGDTDIFGRQPVAQAIVNLADKVDGEFTLMLDGPWGSGKTVFLRQFQKYTETQGYPTIYLDAFKHDLKGDAYTAIAGRILEKLADDNSTLDNIKGKLASFSRASTRFGLNALVRVATAGIVTGADLENALADDAINSAAKDIEASAIAHIGAMLTQDSQSSAELEALQTQLNTVANSLVEAHKADQDIKDKDETPNPKKRIFFIVDELDRCRPDFALDLLECVKHFFDTEQVVFLLAADTDRLIDSIDNAYGLKTAAKGYLEKFYDQIIYLPLSLRNKSIAQIFAETGCGSENHTLIQLIIGAAARADSNSDNLRHIYKANQLASAISILLDKGNQQHSQIVSMIVPLLCYLAVSDPQYYKTLIAGKVTADDFKNRFSVETTKDDYLKHWPMTYHLMVYILGGEVSDQDKSDISTLNFSFDELLKQIDGFAQNSQRPKTDLLLFSKNEYLDKFMRA